MKQHGPDEIVRLLRIYMPAAFARQLAGDLMRSETAKRDPAFLACWRDVWTALRTHVDGTANDYKVPT